MENMFLLTEIAEKKNKEIETAVAAVAAVTEKESDVSNYHQLVCVFCGKGLMENDWVQDDFTSQAWQT